MPRNWADSIYPWLERAGWQESIGAVLETVSGPFLPYIAWQMDASAWHFCSLRRPSGIPVLFSLEGTPWMSSSAAFPCVGTAAHTGWIVSMACPMFSAAEDSKSVNCVIRGGGNSSITPPEKLKRNGSGSTYRFESEMGIVGLRFLFI